MALLIVKIWARSSFKGIEEFLWCINEMERGLAQMPLIVGVSHILRDNSRNCVPRSLSWRESLYREGDRGRSRLSSKGRPSSWEGGYAINHQALNELDHPKSTDNLEPAEVQDNVINESINEDQPSPTTISPSGEPLAGITTRSRIRDSEVASTHKCLYVNFLSEIEPKKLIEAMEEEGWIITMQKELSQFERNKEGIDYKETFAPVARLEAIRIFLAYAAYMGFMVYRMDAKSAFQIGKFQRRLRLPPKAWYKTLLKFLIQYKFVRDLLQKYDLADSASVKCLMLPPNNLGPDESGVSVNETLFGGMIGYLKGTPNLGLWYPKGSGFDLKAYSDSDYVGCNLDRKSTSGGCQVLGGKFVCWSTKKQSSVAMSSAEAEYVAVAGCCDIELHFVPTDLQLADIFTKPLAEPRFTRLVAELELSPEPVQSLLPPFGEANADDSIDKYLFRTSMQPLAEETVATADTTQSIDASELVEELGNQPKTAEAKKVAESQNEGPDATEIKNSFTQSAKATADNILDETVDHKASAYKPSDPIGPLKDKWLLMPFEERMPELLNDTLKSILPNIIKETIQQALPKFDQRIQETLKSTEELLKAVRNKVGKSMKKTVWKEMDIVKDHLSYCGDKLDKGDVHIRELVNVIKDMVFLLDSANVFKQAKAEGQMVSFEEDMALEIFEKAKAVEEAKAIEEDKAAAKAAEEAMANPQREPQQISITNAEETVAEVQGEQPFVQELSKPKEAPPVTKQPLSITEQVSLISTALVVHTA
ncbi:retrovirus-related pol polyprotein from transposon TNT 1-94 [Tanacetum coccineum]